MAGRRARTAAEAAGRFRDLERERLAGAPLQYLEGTAAFGPLELAVDPRVLIPRPETEQLWELACGLVSSPDVIVDLCTGSGALALALKHAFPQATVYGADLSADALQVARGNGRTLGLEVEWRQGDLFAALSRALEGMVDLVVSNPPYVAEHEWETLAADVRAEPRMALVAGRAGTEVLDRIGLGVGDWLRPGGAVACEIGETQGEHCRRVFATRLDSVDVKADLTGRDRFVVGFHR